jgi:hypothetical protein
MPDNSERRSRLVTLVYRVLSKFTTPAAGEADSKTYERLASAFHKQAAQALDEEAEAAGKATKDKRNHRASNDNDDLHGHNGKSGDSSDSS